MKAGKSGGKKPVASDTDANVDQPRLPWTSRLWASVGLPWILTGLASYTLLTVLGQQFLHNPKALVVLREQVPLAVYDRSTSIFLTALAIDLLNIVFERQTIKLDCVLLPAFIKGMASTTNVLVRFFVPVMALTDGGRPVVVQRYICWMHTTPSILMLLKMISTTITYREATMAILSDEVMVVTGVLALMTTGWQRVLWAILTHLAMLPVVPYMHKAFTEAMEQIRARPLQLTMLFIYVLNLILWCTFAVTWDLALLGWISVMTEEVLYVACDFSAKVLFSSTLMLSSFKEFEARRENAMRVIEGSSKAKLITELQALLEQKERFMSSVSHELRTPLNGIIGISEGMLSGCCGVLPEGVRRQIYIIRTSGARLLALINDVMDAAALRQNKLVLKQEQVVLRHVVDDVLDLTRSLVDSEVVLANLVPPRMLVTGDTGRIVQILNNLLGNAAKFTRRGQIRVTARQVEGGRRVAVTVSDTGIGIPRNKLATIFLPFEQVDMSISRKYGGFGLGLNIVQELVKAHGGTINVSSIEGKGSAFTFTLPLARAMGRESLEEAKAAAQREGSLVSTQDGSTSATATAAAGGAGGAGVGGRSGSGSGAARVGGGGDAGGAGTVTATASATLSVATAPRGPGGGGGGDGGGDDSSTVVSSSDAASRRPGGRGAGQAATCGTGPDSELEQYGELMYNAAELAALASSRPYAQSVRDSMPASLEGGNSPALQSPLMGQGGAPSALARGGGGGARAAGKAAAAAAAGAAGGDGGGGAAAAVAAGTAGEVFPSSEFSSLPGGEAKIIHGPRPFHYTMYKRFLLLSVDDDPVNQSVIKSLLGSTGYEVVAVPSGPEALRYVSSAPALPDLVLLDCMMPEMDGYEVLQRLRAMTPNVHVPIIMVSAQTEEEHVVCGLDLGADDYVTKPFKRNELLARIRAQLAYGEWEHDEGAIEAMSSLVAAEYHGGGGGGGGIGGGVSLSRIASASVELESGNGDVSGSATAAAAAMAAVAAAAAAAAGGGSGVGSGGAAPVVRRPSLADGGGGGGGSSGASLGGEQRLIVCIDDDDVNQVVLQGMLTSQQYRYVRASTGAQGLSYVCGAHNGGIPPDLVLLDCSLPDMTGFDVCRCIRQMYNKQQVPIIMLSARHNESAVVEGLKCGANTYVTKPFRRNELLARIRLHLRSREPLPGHSPFRADSGVDDSSDPRVGAAALSTLAAAAAAAEPGGGGGMILPPPLPGMMPAGGGGGPRQARRGDASGSVLITPGGLSASASAAGGLDGGGGGGVRVWREAAVLVVAVADYAGLCHMLMPGEMADLSARMAAAFDRAIASYGAVRIEASSGVMSAAVLPSAPAPLLPPDADAEAVAAAAAAAAAAAGLRLAALHRVGRALLEAAATLPVPGTSTCLQLQEALALGTIMGHCTAPVVGSTMLYFGPVLAELLDLARRAPPMTIVSPDGEAQALRASGAAADIRGPLFLEPEDGGGGAGGAAGAAAAAARRLWLVEAHPFAHQYLPPQLLFSSNVLAMRPGSFFQRSLAADTAAAALAAGSDEQGKVSGSASAAAAASLHLAAHAPPPPPPPRTLAATPGQGDGAAGGPLSALPVNPMTAGELAHVASASNSVTGFNASLGLYSFGGGGGGLGISLAASRAFSQTCAGPDSDAWGRLAQAAAHPSLSPPPPSPPALQYQQPQPLAPQGASQAASSTGHTASGNGGSTSQPVSGNGNGGGGGAGNGNGGGLGSPTGYGPTITFSLQAAAAAAAAAATTAAASAASNSGRFAPAAASQSDALGGLLSFAPAAHNSLAGGIGGGAASASGIASSVSAAGMLGTSLLYGSGQRAPNVGTGGGAGGAAAGGGLALALMDPEATAAEPQIRALRNELAAMRLQLEALQSGAGREPTFGAAPTIPLNGAQATPLQRQLTGSHSQSLGGGVSLAPGLAPAAPHGQGDVPARSGGGGAAAAAAAPPSQPAQPRPLQPLQPPQPPQQQQQQDRLLAAPAPVPAPAPAPSSAASTDGGGRSTGGGAAAADGASVRRAGNAKKGSRLSRLFGRSGKGGPEK
ncbi:Hexokinase-3 [Pleodorina starrii]|uniref:histidine kinase n=1 Tax=Pleodorina starrii TaxID=330485 RepID=A0A9W6BTF8_9CHLO|nr:Hexokinase-3 [Pleodorina starrii]GLC57753.1 Hexokinase-3 [Pleodorina starrii]GLC75945.1 Hexokinase-3 [Pleodorina starrii]